MYKIIFLLLTLYSSYSYAECYMRSATIKETKLSVTRVADIRRHVTPLDNEHFKCNVSFRAEINYVWHSGEGQSVGANGDSIDLVCSQALNAGRSYLLSKISDGRVLTENEMICTDRPEPSTKSVKIGDVIQLSEVAPHPQKPNFFNYKGSQCRWFVESDFDINTRDLFQWQGIVCNVRKGEWQVIDKF